MSGGAARHERMHPAWREDSQREVTEMVKRTGFTKAAVKIGRAVGRADRKARKMAKAADVAREEIAELSKQVEQLGRDIKKASRRVKRALG